MNRQRDDNAQDAALDSGTDLRHLVGYRRMIARWGGAALSGLLLSAAFPPLEIDWLVWFAFVPLLLAPVPVTPGRRCAVGYVFGVAHFFTSLYWLNEVGFGAGVLLALVCALFPMLWYVAAASMATRVHAAVPAAEAGHTIRLAPIRPDDAVGYSMMTILLPAAWVAVEWVRAWIFTGFPWNQLGISQFRHLGLIRPVVWTGVYGISFLIVAANLIVIWMVNSWRLRFAGRPARRFPLPVALGILMMLPGFYLGLRQPDYGRPQTVLTIAGIQGNIPQTRVYTQDQLRDILEVYDELTRAAVEKSGPDLVVWPETAIPAPARYNALYARVLTDLFRDLETPMLIGTLDYRPAPLSDDPDDMISLNSALYFGAHGQLKEYYDKVRIVPFGEFVPLEDHLPGLVDLIGMGRSLTPGTEYTVFQLPNGANAGVNICYEDAYPGISRRFVLNGANVLMTLTNDAWFEQSSGSRQHLIHAVFRAVENQRPLFRSGNNSETCLILPDGRIVGLLYDAEEGTKFVRGYGVYDVPVWSDLPVTFYTRHGDLFAKACALLTMAVVAALVYRAFARKRALAERIDGDLPA